MTIQNKTTKCEAIVLFERVFCNTGRISLDSFLIKGKQIKLTSIVNNLSSIKQNTTSETKKIESRK